MKPDCRSMLAVVWHTKLVLLAFEVVLGLDISTLNNRITTICTSRCRFLEEILVKSGLLIESNESMADSKFSKQILPLSSSPSKSDVSISTTCINGIAITPPTLRSCGMC
uniref:Putative secreted protein n=1 Tax=Panstrongylus lignarius TaxID=156445 RepID=A0A224XU32_9HEMI